MTVFISFLAFPLVVAGAAAAALYPDQAPSYVMDCSFLQEGKATRSFTLSVSGLGSARTATISHSSPMFVPNGVARSGAFPAAVLVQPDGGRVLIETSFTLSSTSGTFEISPSKLEAAHPIVELSLSDSTTASGQCVLQRPLK